MATANAGTSPAEPPPSKPRVTFFGKPHHNYGLPDAAFSQAGLKVFGTYALSKHADVPARPPTAW